jgi:hypothetical protein
VAHLERHASQCRGAGQPSSIAAQANGPFRSGLHVAIRCTQQSVPKRTNDFQALIALVERQLAASGVRVVESEMQPSLVLAIAVRREPDLIKSDERTRKLVRDFLRGMVNVPADDPEHVFALVVAGSQDQVKATRRARRSRQESNEGGGILSSRTHAERVHGRYAGVPRRTLGAARLACQTRLAAPDSVANPLDGRSARLQAVFDALVTAGHGERWGDVPGETLLTLGNPEPVLRRSRRNVSSSSAIQSCSLRSATRNSSS